MKNAVVIYHSKTGITKRYAHEISKHLNDRAIDTQVASIQQFRPEMLDQADYVLLGCWTNGLMVILQHPEKVWVEFARKLPRLPAAKLALFTTYKLLTGSMFKNMNKHLDGKFTSPALELKSRNGGLSEKDKAALDNFIQ